MKISEFKKGTRFRIAEAEAILRWVCPINSCMCENYCINNEEIQECCCCGRDVKIKYESR